MIKMSKFYDLVSRNATITLQKGKRGKLYYTGSLKNLPDQYDNWEVIDFEVTCDGDFIFQVQEPMNDGFFELTIPDSRTGGYRKAKVYIPTKEDDE